MSIRKDSTSIHVDFARTMGTISELIYGTFIEHIGACVYGGIWAESGTSIPTIRGIRKDIIDLTNRLRPRIIRWPGGCFSEYYHWKDGIGPIRERPLKFSWRWNNPEPNTVGTHEFIDFCRAANTEPFIVVNVRTGSPEEAANWVKYCNDPQTTPMGRLRASNGDPDPFHVKLWGIGNESWDLGAEFSAKKFLEFKREMKKADPSIKVVAVGGLGYKYAEEWEDWDKIFLQIIGEELDYLAPHHYMGCEVIPTDSNSYYANVASPVLLEDIFKRETVLIDKYLSPLSDAGIGIDEWGIWWYESQGMEHSYNLSDGLIAAGVFNAMHRSCRRVKMACYSELVNCLGLIQANSDRAIVTPPYLAFELYSNLCGKLAVLSEVECDVFNTDSVINKRGWIWPSMKNVPFLDISATKENDNSRLIVSVVNRHKDESIKAKLDFKGISEGEYICSYYELNGPEPHSENTFEKPDTIRISKQVLGKWIPDTYEFPPHSLTFFTIEKSPC